MNKENKLAKKLFLIIIISTLLNGCLNNIGLFGGEKNHSRSEHGTHGEVKPEIVDSKSRRSKEELYKKIVRNKEGYVYITTEKAIDETLQNLPLHLLEQHADSNSTIERVSDWDATLKKYKIDARHDDIDLNGKQVEPTEILAHSIRDKNGQFRILVRADNSINYINNGENRKHLYYAVTKEMLQEHFVVYDKSLLEVLAAGKQQAIFNPFIQRYLNHPEINKLLAEDLSGDYFTFDQDKTIEKIISFWFANYFAEPNLIKTVYPDLAEYLEHFEKENFNEAPENIACTRSGCVTPEELEQQRIRTETIKTTLNSFFQELEIQLVEGKELRQEFWNVPKNQGQFIQLSIGKNPVILDVKFKYKRELIDLLPNGQVPENKTQDLVKALNEILLRADPANEINPDKSFMQELQKLYNEEGSRNSLAQIEAVKQAFNNQTLHEQNALNLADISPVDKKTYELLRKEALYGLTIEYLQHPDTFVIKYSEEMRKIIKKIYAENKLLRDLRKFANENQPAKTPAYSAVMIGGEVSKTFVSIPTGYSQSLKEIEGVGITIDNNIYNVLSKVSGDTFSLNLEDNKGGYYSYLDAGYKTRTILTVNGQEVNFDGTPLHADVKAQIQKWITTKNNVFKPVEKFPGSHSDIVAYNYAYSYALEHNYKIKDITLATIGRGQNGAKLETCDSCRGIIPADVRIITNPSAKEAKKAVLNYFN